VMSIMANHWALRGEEVTLITFASQEGDFYEVHPGVRRVALDLQRESQGVASLLLNTRRIKGLRDAIRRSRPQVVVSFIDKMNVLTLFSLTGTDIPVVVSERVDPTLYDIGTISNLLRRRLYPRARFVVVQTGAVARWAASVVSPSKVRTIPNPIGEWTGPHPTYHLPEGHTVLAAGRLVPQKGFDLLLQACARTLRPDWSLVICGEGPERQRLQRLASELGIEDRVHMPGVVSGLRGLLPQADIFVLSSRFEGFPNVLLEAMAAGLGVIAFDCPSGPADIVHHEIDGLLVPAEDADALAKSLEQLTSDENARARLGAKARDVMERFSTERVMKLWSDLLEEVGASTDSKAHVRH
jgi:GalNAc-alpha-(1->4)-GalNAc-alpha-(1->3)-diNAcBac-PP-undecaprenol alpha-1,4-N-acetyl-D-galactosaminyltransferase